MFKALWIVITNGYIYGTIAIAYLFLVNFPGSYMPILSGPDVDGSWNYALNYLPYSSYLFGRDVVFTYGPLGFLIRPQNIGSNLAFGLAFQVAVHVLFTLALCYFLYRARHKLQVVLFVVLYLAVNMLAYGVLLEYNLSLTLGMLLCISFDSNRILKYGSLALSGLLAGLLFFTKFSAGIIALSMLCACAVIIIFTWRGRAWKMLIAAGGTYLVTVTVIAFACMHSADNIIQWLAYSLDIANGYGEAMSIEGSGLTLALGLSALVAYLVLVLVLWKQKAHCLYASLLFILPVILVFKHAFCRQDPCHELYIFALPAIVCIVILNEIGKKELFTCLAGFTIILALTAPMYQPKSLTMQQLSEVVREKNHNASLGTLLQDNYRLLRDSKAGFLEGQWGLTNIGHIIDFNALQSYLDEQSRASLEKDRLPEEMVSVIKSGYGTVGVIPWEICYCPANGLEWKPGFTLQSYLAYTSALDLRDAANYTGAAAPEFLIVEFATVDYRNTVLDTPAVWSKIISNYEVAYHDSAGRLLLKKKAQEGVETRRSMGSVAARADTWIDIPQTDNLLFAKVDMQLNLAGRLAKTFFRVPPVYIDLIYESGRTVSYKLVADTARNGLLINFLPNNTFELAGILNGVARDRVAKFLIRGNGAKYYDGEFAINWEESGYLQILRQPELRDILFSGVCWTGSIDMVNSSPRGPEGTVYSIEDGKDQAVILQGWMVDEKASKSAAGVFVSVDGKYDLPAKYGFNRNDVAKYYNIDDYKSSGFGAIIPTSLLGKGKHILTLKIVAADETGYYEFHEKINIEVK